MKKYFVGFDIGTDSVHLVVMNRRNEIIFTPDSLMHFGNPVEALGDAYIEIIDKYGYDNIALTAFTGSAGEFIAGRLGMPFLHDTIAIPAGAGLLAPYAGYIFHIGAKDSYFFEMENILTGNRYMSFTPDHGTGTKCGGGSGILITKQCRRFFENEFPVKIGSDRKKNRLLLQERLKKTFRRAEEELSGSGKNISVGGRCGVVIQSDMIHLQNRGEDIADILKGMYERIVKNYISDVLKTRKFNPEKKALATGGVFRNRRLIEMLENELGLTIEVPEHFEKIGAAGAVVKSCKSEKKFMPEKLEKIAQSERDKIKRAPSLKSSLAKIKSYNDKKPLFKKDDLIIYNSDLEEKDVLIGMDGGSTTTKAVVADAETVDIAAEICLYTNGKPLEAALEIFRQIKEHLGNNIKIRGMAYTGSSGAFYHKLFTDTKKAPHLISSDIVKDEITCHAAGVKHFNPHVDTIFELGGQDAKFTLFNRDGTVRKSKMNLSCMAGTGQTMQNMVEMVGLDIESTFHEYALSAETVPVVDDTCGVFTEAGIAKLIALGLPKNEIAAAIVYGFMGGYVNKFIGNEKFGNFASAQGGPFKGESCLAALALLTGMEIHAFPHRQLFGALGAAILLSSEMKRFRQAGIDYRCKFRGLDIADAGFKKSTLNCSKVISDSCGIKDCRLQIFNVSEDIVYSGGACPKGNTGLSAGKAPNYIEHYRKILNRHIKKYSIDIDTPSERERILIPRSLSFLNEKGVFYTALYNSLGFDISVSPESNDHIVDAGINYSHSETCYPVKLAHGHAAYLRDHMRRGLDKILLVNLIGTGNKRFCPYVASDGFLSKDALHIDNGSVLLPVIHFKDSANPIDKTIFNDLKRVYGNRFSINDVRNAIEKAEDAERKFLDEIYQTGEKIISGLKKKNEKIFIALGRGYTIFDDKASSKIHELFALKGLHFIPSFFISDPAYDLSDIAENMYWYQGYRIINYTLMAAMDPLIFPVRETNFNCGTDSMLHYHEEYIMNLAEKPFLVLQTDGHSSNAQFGTRTEANYEVVTKYRQKKLSIEDFRRKVPAVRLKKRILGLPYMGENSHVISASFRALGFESEVIPTRTERAVKIAKKLISTNSCSPFAFQVGDCMAWLYEMKEKGVDPNERASVFQPMAKGPCRFGQYHVLLRKFFQEYGFENVSIVNPDSDDDYSNIPIDKESRSRLIKIYFKGTYCNDLLEDALLRTRPYEKVGGSADSLYKRLAKELINIVEKGSDTKELVRFMEHSAELFSEVIDTSLERKPIVAMNGEIFVRSHPEANQYSIKLLEKYGLEVKLASLSQWIEYTNKKSIKLYRREKEWQSLFRSALKRAYMKKTGEKLYAPFKKLLTGRKPHDTEDILEFAQRELVYDKLVTGESPLSIGEAYMFTKGLIHDISGIYHVGPFGCMHETAATSQIQSLTEKHRSAARSINERIVPFMDAVFGDSELPNLEAEIAAFAEKCYLKKEILRIEN